VEATVPGDWDTVPARDRGPNVGSWVGFSPAGALAPPLEAAASGALGAVARRFGGGGATALSGGVGLRRRRHPAAARGRGGRLARVRCSATCAPSFGDAVHAATLRQFCDRQRGH